MDTRARSISRPALRLSRSLPQLFLVTDDEIVGRAGFAEQAEAAVYAGGRRSALQLRAASLSARAFWDLAVHLKAVADDAGASLWVNDRIDVALAVRADGVQLPRASLPVPAARALLGRSTWIGRSVHSIKEAADALSEGADLAVLGAVYRTESHRERAPLGVDELRRAAAAAQPIVAIGGITPERARDVIEAGAWGVAVRSGIWDAPDAAAVVHRYLRALDEV